jgi:ADP-ribose pyrophosphatase
MCSQKNGEILEHRVAYEGRLLRLEVDRVAEPGGVQALREVVRHPGSAVVLPLTPEGRLVLVRQYRYAVGGFLWEAPAGHIEPGELPVQAACRELVEETGYYPNRLEKLLEFYPAPGFTDELMHLFFAGELEQKGPSPEADEKIEVKAFTLEEAQDMVASKKIRDAKTLVGLSFIDFLRDRRGGR